MGRTMAKRTKKLVCPSCGNSIHFRHGRDRIGICPECGEWLTQRGWPSRRLEQVDEEAASAAFDESDAWERALTEEIE